MSTVIDPTVCKISFAEEASFRDGGGSEAALATVYAFDLTKEYTEPIEIPDPKPNDVEKWTNETRNVGRIVRLGFSPGSKTWEFEMLTGILIYYALGGITNTGAGAPFTHTIAEANTLPSFALHIEQEISGDAIRQDLLGCIVVSLEITVEEGSETPVMCSVEILTAKVITGSDLAEPASVAVNRFVRSNLETLSLTYSSAEIDTLIKTYCDKVSVKIINEVEMKTVFGDEYPKRVVVKTRDYEVRISTAIRSSTWRTISLLKCPSYAAQYGTTGYYATAIAFSLKIARHTTDDYISIAMTKLRLDPTTYNPPLVLWETPEARCEMTFKGAPGNACSSEVKDALAATYY